MRELDVKVITENIKEMCIEATHFLTEDMKNTDMLYWGGTMNSIKNQAEEIVLKEIIYQ